MALYSGGIIMQYENVNILGSYSLRDGGNINIFMGKNLASGTEVNTYIHELFHMHLTNSSSLGFFLLLLEKEYNLASGAEDMNHCEKIKELSEIIFNRTVYVQEVYANSQELLWIENNLGPDIAEKAFNLKNKDYKDYCNKMRIITSNKKLRIERKKYLIDKICLYALGIPISSDKFISALKSRQKLHHYFSGDLHPKKRLDIALEKYSRNEDLKEENTILINYLLSGLRDLEIIKYFDKELPELNEVIQWSMKNGTLDESEVRNWIEINQKKMDEKIKLFDFYNLKVERVQELPDGFGFGVFVIKNCLNIHNKDNFYFISHSLIKSNSTYVSNEAPYGIIENSDIKVIGISSYEYDLKKMKPSYLNECKVPVVVLIDNFNHAKEIIKRILNEGELFIGDLYGQNVNNFSTVLFFRERTDPETIFVFPTLKKLSIRIIKELEISQELVFSNDKYFKRILSAFGDELDMLEFIQWIFGFIMQSSCNFTEIDDPATKLSFDLTKTMMNNIFEINEPGHYRRWASLPTKKTLAQPYYSLMEFKNGRNTGSFYGFLYESDHVIIFFTNKIDALNYKARMLSIDESIQQFHVVGIDKHFWNTHKKILSKIKICVCIDNALDIVILVTVNYLDSKINS